MINFIEDHWGALFGLVCVVSLSLFFWALNVHGKKQVELCERSVASDQN